MAFPDYTVGAVEVPGDSTDERGTFNVPWDPLVVGQPYSRETVWSRRRGSCARPGKPPTSHVTALRHWVGSFGGPGLQALRNELVGCTRRAGCVLRRSTSGPGVQCATRVEAARPTGGRPNRPTRIGGSGDLSLLRWEPHPLLLGIVLSKLKVFLGHASPHLSEPLEILDPWKRQRRRCDELRPT